MPQALHARALLAHHRRHRPLDIIARAICLGGTLGGGTLGGGTRGGGAFCLGGTLGSGALGGGALGGGALGGGVRIRRRPWQEAAQALTEAMTEAAQE